MACLFSDHMFKEMVKFMKYDGLIADESGRPKCKRTRPLKRSNWSQPKPSKNKVKINVINSIT